ncbi:MAG: hypothetical protein LKJ80_02620 [Oscillibacter sp.]|jgi:hypothetical protein|nr:hypothetical protein [Oscillibacter sp.]
MDEINLQSTRIPERPGGVHRDQQRPRLHLTFSLDVPISEVGNAIRGDLVADPDSTAGLMTKRYRKQPHEAMEDVLAAIMNRRHDRVAAL